MVVLAGIRLNDKILRTYFAYIVTGVHPGLFKAGGLRIFSVTLKKKSIISKHEKFF